MSRHNRDRHKNRKPERLSLLVPIEGATPDHQEEEKARIDREMPEQLDRMGYRKVGDTYEIKTDGEIPHDLVCHIAEHIAERGEDGEWKLRTTNKETGQTWVLYVFCCEHRIMIGSRASFERIGMHEILDGMDASEKEPEQW